MPASPLRFLLFIGLLLSLATAPAFGSNSSRLLATGGATALEGAAGGGIVPWSVLAGYADSAEFGGTAWYTRVDPDDFQFDAFGIAASFHNRIELSAAKQTLDINSVIPGEELEQTVIGLKYRLAGDLVYTALPQISAGIMHKRNDAFDVPMAVGAADSKGTDFYLSASKLWLAGPFDRSVFFNLTLRATRANQLGLLGFGGDKEDSHEVVAETSAGIFLNRHWVLGAEYRQKPDNLSFATEDDWHDVFVGWFPNKRVALVAAWSDLGSIAGQEDQDAFYLSLQLSR